MSQSFLDKLTSRITGRRDKAVASFDSLVRAVADDKPPSAEQAEAVLTDAGLTPEDLAKGVKRAKDRRQAAAALSRGQAAAWELEAVEAKARAANESHAAAVEKLDTEHEAVMTGLRTRVRELDKDVAAMRQAEAFLRESADHDAEQTHRLKAQLVEAKRLADQHLTRAHKAAVAARDAATGANARRGNWNNPALDNEGYRQSLRDKAAAADQVEAEALKLAEPHAERVRDLEGQLAALEELALKP